MKCCSAEVVKPGTLEINLVSGHQSCVPSFSFQSLAPQGPQGNLRLVPERGPEDRENRGMWAEPLQEEVGRDSSWASRRVEVDPLAELLPHTALLTAAAGWDSDTM